MVLMAIGATPEASTSSRWVRATRTGADDTMLPAGIVTLGVTTEVNLAGRAVASSAKPAAKESTWATPTVTSWATGLVRRT